MNVRYAYRVLDKHDSVLDLDAVVCMAHSEPYLRAFLLLGLNPVREPTQDACLTCALRAFDDLASERARRVAIDAHRGQLDKGGQPYIRHPGRVAKAVREAGYGDDAQAVAWLHDVVEDTEVTLEQLQFLLGFSSTIVAAVDAISQRKKEKAPDYYLRVLQNPLAHVVKWFDVADNASADRMARLAPETRERLTAKYVQAVEWLGGPGSYRDANVRSQETP